MYNPAVPILPSSPPHWLSHPGRTQSVVKGAPLAISSLTSSSWPWRAASRSLFPRSMSDIFIQGNSWFQTSGGERNLTGLDLGGGRGGQWWVCVSPPRLPFRVWLYSQVERGLWAIMFLAWRPSLCKTFTRKTSSALIFGHCGCSIPGGFNGRLHSRLSGMG